MSKVLEEANGLGLAVLAKLMGSDAELNTRFEGKALNPAVLVSNTFITARTKCIILVVY
jgi:hypothetical protein